MGVPTSSILAKTYATLMNISNYTEKTNNGISEASMVIAGYVSVCVQLYCILIFTVFHYMFRPTLPSSSVQFSSYISFHMLKGFCFAAFLVRCLFFHVFTFCMFSICVLFLCCFPSLLLLFPCVCASRQTHTLTCKAHFAFTFHFR
jgi:hypothetical protein